LIGIGRRATITTLCVEAIWRIFEDRLPIVIYTGHSFLSPAKFERCVPSDMTIKGTSASPKNISVRAEWLRQSGRTPSEPSETPRWRITPRPASIPRIALHIALRSPFRHVFLLCRSPILNKHSGIGANCDHTSQWVHWVHVCMGIAMGDAAKISPRVPSTLRSRSIGR